jgi:hypothetical protein
VIQNYRFAVENVCKQADAVLVQLKEKASCV